MRYLMLYRPDRNPDRADPPTPEHVAKMNKYVEAQRKAGILLDTGALEPTTRGARVRLAKGQVTVIDGPFAGNKGLVSGYAIVEADSREHAIELTKEFLGIAGDGETEIRELFAPPSGGSR